MFGLLQKLGFGDPVREARQLNKDAQDILEMIHNVHGATRLAEIADVIRTARREVQERQAVLHGGSEGNQGPRERRKGEEQP